MTTWNIFSHETNPTILLEVTVTAFEGYILEGTTANPNYLVDSQVLSYSDKRITLLAFRNRFSKEEKIRIDLASIDDPTTSQAMRELAASLRVDLKDSDAATFIDLARPDTIAAVIALETYTLIGVGRANEILNNPIEPIERLTSHDFA